MAAAIPWVIGAGIGTSLVGGMQEADAMEQAAGMNAAVMEENANIAEANTKEQESRYRRQVRRQMGSMRANVGGSGIQMTGSALDVLADSAAEAELDALTIRHEGKLEARSLRQNAKIERAGGKARAGARRTSAVGNALFSAGSAGTKL